ncbi:hypothetical protein BU25DRAFT_454890 [Macroventuria anomochaeta]|uniref:Uncharacterized protein n=1 Tax=Macroventuria anomochaeta TaxID=301207 RepID=A0ACB6SD63_9PLEO|nr:uncharacterized protein BU25DRAFT_454890 [Macroventuria anomochaeta]KAF2631437.1 hypothetical protein BU25DRAFT_454890 [Macroventuria anomochaeta]
MAPFDASAMPALDKRGTNLWRWEAAFKRFAQANACDDLLSGVLTEPIVVPLVYDDEPTTTGTSAIPDQATLRAVVAQVRADNSYRQGTYRRELAALNSWKQSNVALQLAILNTVPRDIYEGVRHLPIDQQYKAIVARFRKSGVAEECTIWGNFFSLRAHHCPTTAVFTDQFKAGLAKIDNMNFTISEKCKAYQFILAVQDAYPEYARNRRADLRRNVIPKVDQMCNEINYKARCDDPVKAAYATMKQKTDNNKPGGGGYNHDNP